MNRHFPPLVYGLALAVYLAACFYSSNALLVAIGYLCGCASQWALENKRA